MKKYTLIFLSMGLLITTIPTQSKASTIVKNNVIIEQNSETKESAQVLLKRLYEINSLDKSTINGVKKNKLRNEVINIKEKLSKLSDGVYLSVGALLVIVILLIILF